MTEKKCVLRSKASTLTNKEYGKQVDPDQLAHHCISMSSLELIMVKFMP